MDVCKIDIRKITPKPLYTMLEKNILLKSYRIITVSGLSAISFVVVWILFVTGFNEDPCDWVFVFVIITNIYGISAMLGGTILISQMSKNSFMYSFGFSVLVMILISVAICIPAVNALLY